MKVITVRETHHLMVMHPHTKYHWPTSKDKNVMVRTRKYYLKNNYSKVKVPRRSLWYATYRLMVLHPHTNLERQKCYGPDKKILFKKQLFDLEVKGQCPTKVITVRDTALWSYIYELSSMKFCWIYLTLRSKVKVPRRSLRYATHRLMVMHIRTICPWTVLLDLFELFDLKVKDHYGTWHATLWSCTHIPIIIDLPRKTKMLWPRQENTI